MKFVILTGIAVLLGFIASISAKDQGCTAPSTTATKRTTAASTTAPPEVVQSIYFATNTQGISAFSLETNQVMKIINSSEDLVGITYDSISSKLYWSSWNGTIYRSNRDGKGTEMLLSIAEYGMLYDLDFDLISGNVYVATTNGYIVACGDGATPSFKCFTILSGQHYLRGITLDPTAGFMYWTRYDLGSIHKAGMDGSSPLTLVTGLGQPRGVTIDIASGRLYWAELNSHQIQSSDLDGREVRLVVQLPAGSWPWGVAVSSDRIYWGNDGNYKLQSSTKDGEDIRTLLTESNQIRQVTIVPGIDQPKQRVNDCAGRNCTTLCVLTQSSYRCLA